MLFRFIVALYVVTVWPRITWEHAFWAMTIAFLTFPLKKLWDWWAERFWLTFKTSFMAQFKQTPEGKQFLDNFYKTRAEKDQQIVKEHPELKKVLACKTCNGVGKIGDEVCEDCGGTGWS